MGLRFVQTALCAHAGTSLGRRWLPGRHLLAPAVLLALARGTPACARQQPRQLLVSATSDVAKAFTEIGGRFTRRTGIAVSFNFGSTRGLAGQIENGAPVDLFAAADEASMDQLARKGLVIPGTRRVYAFGSLVIWLPPNSEADVQSLRDLASPRIRRIAVARPERGCLGSAAHEALRRAGVWHEVQRKLVCAENVRQALQYAEGGMVDVAITARSLVGPCRGRKCKGTWVPIPEDLHRPIRQVMAIIRGTPHEAEARRFAAFVMTLEGTSILARHGFLVNCAPAKESARP